MHQLIQRLNKPGSVSLCTLDLRKTVIYDFHYNQINVKKVRILFTDMDCLKYETKQTMWCEDFYQKILFHFKEYPENLNNYDATHKNVNSKMKDETKSIIIVEFGGLKSGMYSLI